MGKKISLTRKSAFSRLSAAGTDVRSSNIAYGTVERNTPTAVSYRAAHPCSTAAALNPSHTASAKDISRPGW